MVDSTRTLIPAERLIIQAAVEQLEISESDATKWVRTYPIPGFGGRTLAEVIADGKIQAALAHVAQVADGGYA
jgi:hypothetical protein